MFGWQGLGERNSLSLLTVILLPFSFSISFMFVNLTCALYSIFLPSSPSCTVGVIPLFSNGLGYSLFPLHYIMNVCTDSFSIKNNFPASVYLHFLYSSLASFLLLQGLSFLQPPSPYGLLYMSVTYVVFTSCGDIPYNDMRPESKMSFKMLLIGKYFSHSADTELVCLKQIDSTVPPQTNQLSFEVVFCASLQYIHSCCCLFLMLHIIRPTNLLSSS